MTDRLSQPQRILFYALNLGLGLVPSVLFFAWVALNCALPWIPIELDWPWVSFPEAPLAARASWDVALFLGFGLFHSLFAQPAAHRALERLVPPHGLRSVYLAITGTLLLGVMGCWQSTGVVLWALPLPQKATITLSIALYALFMAGVAWVFTRFGFWQFLGLRQIVSRKSELSRTEGMGKLIDTGIYGLVRHPLYTFTILAFIVTPLMTLDRALVALATAIYLVFAIPVEERKLIAIFGRDYEDYRRRVPAVIPGLKRLTS